MEIDMQEFTTCVMQNFGEDIATTKMEIILCQNDLALKSLFSNTKCIWSLVRRVKYPVLCRVSWKVKESLGSFL
nr:unnamed protein product [Callosobruchus chinensis]